MLSVPIAECQVARRDEYTCCFTGLFEEDIPVEDLARLVAQGKTVDRASAMMEAAHIFKRSVAVWKDSDEDKVKVRHAHVGRKSRG